MFKWFKKKQEPVETYATRAFHIERRQHARIRYPKCGALGDLPFITYEGHELRPANLSMGGILITEGVMQNIPPDTIVDLRFFWKSPAREIIQKVRVVRVTNGGCHLKFDDLNPQLLVNLSLALKPGVRAQKTVKSEQPAAPILEAWKSASGEALLFYSQENDAPDAHINLPPKEMLFKPGRGLLVGEKGPKDAEFTFEKPAPAWLIHDLLVFLSNLPKSSPRVQSLVAQLEKLL